VAGHAAVDAWLVAIAINVTMALVAIAVAEAIALVAVAEAIARVAVAITGSGVAFADRRVCGPVGALGGSARAASQQQKQSSKS
jgi:hypothetical protein